MNLGPSDQSSLRLHTCQDIFCTKIAYKGTCLQFIWQRKQFLANPPHLLCFEFFEINFIVFTWTKFCSIEVIAIFVRSLFVCVCSFCVLYYYFPLEEVDAYIGNNASNHPEVFLGKGVLKICRKFTGEHHAEVQFL